MIIRGRWILIALLPFLLNFEKSMWAEESKQEAIFAIQYERFSNDYFVYLKKDSVFVPFEDLLSMLKIYYTVDEKHNFKGYINNADSSFAVLFTENKYIDIDGEEHYLDKNKWFSGDFSIYVRTDLLEEVFKFEVHSLFNRLTVRINSDYVLPLKRSVTVDYISKTFKKEEKEEEFGPLISKNSFTWLNGGILDYSVSGSKSERNEFYDYSGRIGLEILNGEFLYNNIGSIRNSELIMNDYIRWNYTIGSDYLYSVSLGDLHNISLRTTGPGGYRKPYHRLRGVQLTNEDYDVPDVFTDYIIEDYVEPDWTVELYIDDQLYDVQKTDLTGYYRFSLPVSYGNTNMTVKIYGNNGEFISKEKVLRISPSLLPAGDVKYAISAGEEINTKKKLLDGSIHIGLTDWLTSSVSGTKDLYSQEYLLVSQSSFNLFNFATIGITATSTGIYESSLHFPDIYFGNLDFVYTSYDRSVIENSSKPKSEMYFISTLNRFFDLPVTFSLTGRRSQFQNTNNTTLNTNMMINVSNFNLNLRHNFMFSDNLKRIYDDSQVMFGSVSYFFPRFPGILSYLGRMRLNATTNFDPETMEFYDVGGGIQQQIGRNISISAKYDYSFRTKSFRTSFDLNMDLSVFRSRSKAQYNQGSPITYSSSLSGSVEFDSQNLSLTMLNSLGTGNYGKSSASVRFYNDKNFNYKYDEDDEVIPNVEFRITNGRATKRKNDEYTILSSLRPNKRYNIQIKPESFSNPQLLPSFREFSFIAEPYSYKSIDVACHIGGMIEGSINRIKNNQTKEQGGVYVHLVSIDSSYHERINVFSDGSYYYNPIPVGEYIVYPDSSQIAILNCKSVPEYRKIEIKPTDDGDFLSHIDFYLKEKSKKKDSLRFPYIVDILFMENKSSLTDNSKIQIIKMLELLAGSIDFNFYLSDKSNAMNESQLKMNREKAIKRFLNTFNINEENIICLEKEDDIDKSQAIIFRIYETGDDNKIY